MKHLNNKLLVLSVYILVLILVFPGCSNDKKNTKKSSDSVESEYLEDAVEATKKGKWYRVGDQTGVVEEWIFSEDGTCTSEIKNKNGDYKSNPVYCTYTIDENIVIIKNSSNTLYNITWYYDAENEVFWEYFEGVTKIKLKIVGSTKSLSIKEINNMIDNARTFYCDFEESDKSRYNKVFPDSQNNEKNVKPKQITRDDVVNAIKKWDYFMYGWTCCELQDVTSECSEFLPDRFKELAPNVFRIICCDTIEEVKNHIKQYVSETYLDRFNEDMFFEHNGDLYLVRGAYGAAMHDTESLVYKYVEGDTYLAYANKCIGSGKIIAKSTIRLEVINNNLIVVYDTDEEVRD